MSTLAQTIRIYSNQHQTNWPDLLPSVVATWRATPCVNNTLFSPYKLLMGEEMRLPIDTALITKDATLPNVYRHLEDLADEFQVINGMAHENITQAQTQNKQYHDRKAVQHTV